MALCLRPRLNPLINLVTYRPCLELRVRNEVDQIVPGHGKMHSGQSKECSRARRKEWKYIFFTSGENGKF